MTLIGEFNAFESISYKKHSDLPAVGLSYKEQPYDTVIVQQLNRNSMVVTNARHYEALTKADESLPNVLQGLNNNITADFLALDIRRALNFLDEITTDDLSGNIFGK